MSYLTNSYMVSPTAEPSVIFSMDPDGSSGYTIYHTEETDLPVGANTYYLGTNNNGGGGSYSAAAPSWNTGTSSGSWTVSGTSTSKSGGSWSTDYIFGKSALGSANQTATDINFDTFGSTASWIGFLRSSDLSGAQYDEAVNQFGFYLDNGGAVRIYIEGSAVSAPYPPNWTASSKFKIEMLVDV